MIKVPLAEELADFDLRDFSVPPITDKRGFLYILHDSAYPDYIKVGRSADVKKRLTGYNSDKPYPTAKMLYISRMFNDVNDVERRVLEYLYENTSPTTLTREWFELKNKEKILEIIERAESEVH